ncbi:MAG: UDP-N-acetylmuramate dehydrogenase [Brevinematia bacterium]
MKIIFSDVNLSSFSSYKIGGNARYFSTPSGISELKKVLRFAKRKNLQPIIFGHATNIVFPDNPAESYIFISLRNFNHIKAKKNTIFLSAGLPSSILSVIGMLSNTEGLLFTHLLPGSIGGGIYMNARCYENEFSEILDSIYYLDENFNLKIIHRDECLFSYKKSIFQSHNWTIVGADFVLNTPLKKENLKAIKKFLFAERINFSSLVDYLEKFRIKKITEFFNLSIIPQKIVDIENDRIKKHQFDFPSCGSVFKNNYATGQPTGRLIELAGLKGLTSGGARISEYHANFIINLGNATQRDILILIETVKEKVLERFGFIPEVEVRIIKNE